MCYNEGAQVCAPPACKEQPDDHSAHHSQPANQVTLTILHQVEALGTPRGLKLTPETREQLSEELRIGSIETMVADGPNGAGIGWGLHRQSFRQQHDIPDDAGTSRQSTPPGGGMCRHQHRTKDTPP